MDDEERERGGTRARKVPTTSGEAGHAGGGMEQWRRRILEGGGAEKYEKGYSLPLGLRDGASDDWATRLNVRERTRFFGQHGGLHLMRILVDFKYYNRCEPRITF